MIRKRFVAAGEHERIGVLCSAIVQAGRDVRVCTPYESRMRIRSISRT